MDRSIIEHHVDLPSQNNSIVEAPSAMHHRMLNRQPFCRRMVDTLHDHLRWQLGLGIGVQRRELDDPKFGPVVGAASSSYLPLGVPLLVDGEVFIPPIEFPEVP